MFERLFSRRKQGNPPESADGKFRTIPEEEYQRYVFQDKLLSKIFATEAALHNIEDPVEIAVGVMKAACELYDADWCGILIADMYSELWRPEIWYDAVTGLMTETLFYDFEMTKEYVTWVQHLIEQKPIVIPDVEAIRESNPKEYEAYQRLEVKSVLGVPFGQHPLGYMVVRNPKQNIELYEPLQIACFVAMMMVEQKRRLEAERRLISDDGEDDGKLRLRFNILGQHSMEINGRTIQEKDLVHPNRRGWIILLYLVLHKTGVEQMTLAAENWPEEPEKSARTNIRQAVFRLHSDMAYYHDAKVILVDSGRLELSDDVHITTDAEEMEALYLRAESTAETEGKDALLKQAFALYKGRVFETADLDIGAWLMPFSTHYEQIFISITRSLLSLLGHRRDYHAVMDYASKAIRLEPGILDAYYWIIRAGEHIGSNMVMERYDKMAHDELPDEEYEKLRLLLSLKNEPEATE